jgi:hypothetical protein
MAEETPQERTAFIAKLLQRLGNEDWTKWQEQEKQAVDSCKIPLDEAAIAGRELFYDNLLKKIKDEIDALRRETR